MVGYKNPSHPEHVPVCGILNQKNTFYSGPEVVLAYFGLLRRQFLFQTQHLSFLPPPSQDLAPAQGQGWVRSPPKGERCFPWPFLCLHSHWLGQCSVSWVFLSPVTGWTQFYAEWKMKRHERRAPFPSELCSCHLCLETTGVLSWKNPLLCTSEQDV